MCSRSLRLATIALAITAFAACSREERRFGEPSPASQAPSTITLSELQAGAKTAPAGLPSPYEYNAYAVAQGKQLYESFNCMGCHAQGGGAIGPALMDAQWIYGDAPENIFATIVEGRPNGMPSFRGKIPAQQLWQIIAYIRSLSGQVSKDAAPSRPDHLFMKKSEQSTLDEAPLRSSAPPPSQ
jgi:cytochrome c oxidase cbb3-type subunit 3